MKIIESTNIFNEKVNDYLEKRLHSNLDYLYLSATNNVFKEKTDKLSPYFKNKCQMFVSEGFESFITNKVRSSKGYLPLIDMYYILKKVIDDYFKSDHVLKFSYQDIHYKLFELYKFLMFHDINIIPDEFLKRVNECYSKEYFYIFDIYNRYKNTINEIINCINKSDLDKVHYKNEELDIAIIAEKSSDAHFDTFIQNQKMEIYKYLSKINTVYFDGFIAFSYLDKYIIYNAVNLGKEIVFITKEISKEQIKNFLLDNVYEYNLHKEKINIVNLSNSGKDYNERTSINYIRDNFYTFHCQNNDKNLIKDGHINFIVPFPNKSDELEYISRKIAELVKSENLQTKGIDEIKKFIDKNILVVCAVDKETMARHLNSQLTKTGIFAFNTIPDNMLRKKVNLETFDNIYFDVKDFLEENILYKDRTSLQLANKNILFNNSFCKVQIPTRLNLFDSAPVLEFIFQIYDFSKNKVTVDKFRALLFSNWYYHIGKSKTSWDTLLGAFEQIKIYFENK